MRFRHDITTVRVVKTKALELHIISGDLVSNRIESGKDIFSSIIQITNILKAQQKSIRRTNQNFDLLTANMVNGIPAARPSSSVCFNSVLHVICTHLHNRPTTVRQPGHQTLWRIKFSLKAKIFIPLFQRTSLRTWILNVVFSETAQRFCHRPWCVYVSLHVWRSYINEICLRSMMRDLVCLWIQSNKADGSQNNPSSTIPAPQMGSLCAIFL